jgi:hypothetical protein
MGAEAIDAMRAKHSAHASTPAPAFVLDGVVG